MDRLMDFQETKEYLKISRATLYRWVYEKKVPAFKIGTTWRFDKKRIDTWLLDHENLKMK